MKWSTIEHHLVCIFNRLPVALLLGLTVMVSLAFGPAPERVGRILGRLAPVVEYNELEVLSRNPGRTDVVLHMTKLRACSFKSLDFFYVEPDGGLVRIPWSSTFLKTPRTSQSRPLGDNTIYLTFFTSAPIETWTAEITHDCSWMGPYVITAVWPPDV